MVGQKSKMAIAVVLAVVAAFLLLAVSYAFFPDQSSVPVPTPAPTYRPEALMSQLFWAAQLVGLAAAIAFAFVVVAMLIIKIRKGKQQRQIKH